MVFFSRRPLDQTSKAGGLSNDSPMVQPIAEALATEKQKNGYKGKLHKAASYEHKGARNQPVGKSSGKRVETSHYRPKVDLSDLREVQARTSTYLEACALSKSFPSAMGLAGAMGCSRQNLNEWLIAHPGYPATDFINMAKDVFADLLTNASLYNNANAIQVIFQLKNHFEHADRMEFAPVTQNTVNDDYDLDAIRKRYLIDAETEKTV